MIAAPESRRPTTVVAHAWPALPAVAVAVFLLLRLGFDQGGYFPAAFTSAGAIAFIALAIFILRPGNERFSTPALVATGALAAFACWIGLSRTWSVVPDVPLLDMKRAMLYVALFGLGLVASDSGRHARVLLWSVLTAILVVAGAGLLSRLQPELITVVADPLVAAFYRLAYPLNYWNAFGALASLGAVLALGLAADSRGNVALRVAAAGAAVILLVAMYMSLSRGAWLALILGVLVLLAIAPDRGSVLVTVAACGGVAIVAMLRLRGYPALVTDPKAGSGQAAAGGTFTRELVLLVLLAMAAQGAIAGAATRMSARLAGRRRAIWRMAFVAVGVLGLLATMSIYVAKGAEAEARVTAAFDDGRDWLDRQWQDFLDPTRAPDPGLARLTTAKGTRSEPYRVALDGFREHPLIGGGAGSFEVRYAQERRIDEKIRDAHSLPLETLSELGAMGMLLLLAFIGAVAAAAQRAVRGKAGIRPAESAAVSAAFTVWLGHACVDWDWEMPALTGTALVLTATLFGRGRRRTSHRRRLARAA